MQAIVCRSSIDHSLRAFGVSGSQHFDLCGGVLDVSKFNCRDCDFGRSQVFFQPVTLRCARNWHDPRLL